MRERPEATLDRTTLIIRIPMRFHRRGGRKRIVAPDGSAIIPATKPQLDGHANQGASPRIAVAANAGLRQVPDAG